MSLHSQREYLIEMQRRYATSRSRQEKARLIDKVVATLGYHRPVRKVIAKPREGGKVRKRYDQARPPWIACSNWGCSSRHAKPRWSSNGGPSTG